MRSSNNLFLPRCAMSPFGPKADMSPLSPDVRFRGNSGHAPMSAFDPLQTSTKNQLRQPCRSIDAVKLPPGGEHVGSDVAFDGTGSKSPRQSISRLLRRLFQP
jgi:hypothetical protein